MLYADISSKDEQLLIRPFSWKTKNKSVSFQVLVVANMKMIVFRSIAPCSLPEINRPFGRAYCLHHHALMMNQYTPQLTQRYYSALCSWRLSSSKTRRWRRLKVKFHVLFIDNTKEPLHLYKWVKDHDHISKRYLNHYFVLLISFWICWWCEILRLCWDKRWTTMCIIL
jgi:hypothetical protein